MTRILVIAAFLIVSLAVISLAAFFPSGSGWRDLLVNLGTEIFGILLTVAVVEWLLDRRRRQDRAREIAWGVLHSLERAVWVWQGGPRQMGPDELLGVIAHIGRSDPVDPVSLSLLVSLGSAAREALDKETSSIRTLPGLAPSLEDLTSLRSLTDGGSGVPIRMVAEILESSTAGTARVLGLPSQRIPGALVPYRDSSIDAQQARFHEVRGDGPIVQRPTDGSKGLG
jgi:hypothetical protein